MLVSQVFPPSLEYSYLVILLEALAFAITVIVLVVALVDILNEAVSAFTLEFNVIFVLIVYLVLGFPTLLLPLYQPSIIYPSFGMIEGSEMCKYYAAMDTLVHPTYREGFGMVIQEAGALGIPVITTDVPGASEVMENGISAIHVEVKNTQALAKAMWDLSRHPNKVKKLGDKAYQRTKELYARPIMLENQRIDYKKLLN